MNLRYTIVVVLASLLSHFGINASLAGQQPAPIIIGVIHSSTVPFAESMKRSFTMAVEAKNAEGGVKGRPLRLVFADDGLRSSGSIGYEQGNEEQAVKSLVDQGAVMLVGGYSSSNTIHTAFNAESLGMPLLVTTASDNQITQRGFENVYRLNPPANEYAAGVEELLSEKFKPGSMAIVYENSRYGTDAASRMLTYCRKNNIEVRKLVPYDRYRVDEDYFEKRLQPIQKNRPDVLYMVSYLDDAVLLVKTLRKLKIDSLLIGSGGGFTDQRFISRLGEAAEGILTATLWSDELPYAGARDYSESYVERYTEVPDYHGAEAYAAIFVVADVLERAENLDPESIRKALDETDLQTPFGEVRFRSYGQYKNQNTTPTPVLKITDLKFQIVWPGKSADLGSSIPQ